MKRKFRLTQANDFRRMRQQGKTYTHPLLVLRTDQGGEDYPRIGIVVGKPIGNAVRRNRMKRQLRFILAGFLSKFIHNQDIVFIVREPARNASYLELYSAAADLLTKAKIIQTDDHDSRRSIDS